VVYILQIATALAQIDTRDYGFLLTVPYSTLSTGLIQGHSVLPTHAKECIFHFDMRTLPNASAEGFVQRCLAAYAEALAREMQQNRTPVLGFES